MGVLDRFVSSAGALQNIQTQQQRDQLALGRAPQVSRAAGLQNDMAQAQLNEFTRSNEFKRDIKNAFEFLSAPDDQKPLLIQRGIEQAETEDERAQLQLLATQPVETQIMAANDIIKLARQTGIIEADSQLKALSTPGKILVDRGFNVGSPEFEQALTEQQQAEAERRKKSAGRSFVTITQQAQAKDLSKIDAKRLSDLREKVDAGAETLAILDQMESIDINTGPGEGIKLGFAKVFTALGVSKSLTDKITNVAIGQAFESLTSKMVNAGLRLNAGVQTDSDAQRIRLEMASIEDVELARKFKINSMRALILRSREKEDFIAGRMDEGASVGKAFADWNKEIKQRRSISNVVKNPATGLPMFEFEFQQLGEAQGWTPEEIRRRWILKNRASK